MTRLNRSRGQTALEYLLLLAVVAAVVFAGFKTFVPQTRQATEGYYNQVSRVLQGETPQPVNGGWCPAYCPDPKACGPAAISKVCGCPAPAFGGAYCSGATFEVCPRDENVCAISCDAEMKAKCEANPPHPDCICRANPYSCGPPSQGINLCDKACSVPANPGDAVSCAVGGCPPPPPDGQVCPGSNDQVPAGTSWTTVATQKDCGTTKCTLYCNQGKEPNPAGNACVDYFCKGTAPENASLCPGREVGSANASTTLVSSCSGADSTGAECEYVCNADAHKTGNTCTLNCVGGPVPTGKRICPGSNLNATSSGNWHGVDSCDAGDKCAYLDCDQVAPGGNECLFRCQNKNIADASFCAGSDVGLTANKTTTLVSACSAAPNANCEATCISSAEAVGNQCLPKIRCGNGTCDAGAETCSTCPQDCRTGCLPPACSAQADGSILCSGGGCASCPFGTGSFRGATVCNMTDPSTGHVWQGGYYGVYGFTGWRSETQAVICRATGGWDNGWQMRP